MKFTVSTKKDKGAAAINTAVTINWDGATEDTIKGLAVQALIVKVQGAWRKHGIPAQATINVKDYAPGMRHPAQVDVFAAAKELTPEQKKALIAQLSAV